VAFAHWDPLRDLLALQQHLDRNANADTPGWAPPVDVYETPDRYVLTAEVPGLAREHLDIRLQDGTLIVRGERYGTRVPCEQYHRVERGHGAFSRAFSMPDAVDTDAVTADLRDGLLTITVPKAPHAAPRRIAVT
jgi:HSP20 family protein